MKINPSDYGDVTITLNKQKESDFRRLFPLPAYRPDTSALIALGASNGPMFDPNLDENDNPNREPSGFTYFWQFVDHDITLDKTPFVDAPIDITELQNFREPLLNLDSLYGGGPLVNPKLYDNNGRIVLSQDGKDLQRDVNGKAVMAEARNDENMVIAQWHAAVARFHNAMINSGLNFKKAREQTILHYQYLILNDALPRVIPADILQRANDDSIGLYGKSNPNKAYIPVEFSVAAFRIFHSVVRRAYEMRADQPGVKTQVFNANGNDLRGGKVIPPNKIITWQTFFQIEGMPAPVNISRKIDILLSSGLFVLPPDAAPTGPVELAQRNLIRAKSYGLPSGQAVAEYLGLPVYTAEQVGLSDPAFNNEAPLWYYILAESQMTQNGGKIGPVGATIIADTLYGLMRKDKDGILHPSNKKFTPIVNGHNFKVGDFLKFGGL